MERWRVAGTLTADDDSAEDEMLPWSGNYSKRKAYGRKNQRRLSGASSQ